MKKLDALITFFHENYEFQDADFMLLLLVDSFVVLLLVMLFLLYRHKKKRIFIEVTDMDIYELERIHDLIKDIRMQRDIDEPEKGYI